MARRKKTDPPVNGGGDATVRDFKAAAAGEAIDHDGPQRRLAGQERIRRPRIEKAAAAVELLQRQQKVVNANLDAARKTLIHELLGVGGGDVYQVDGVEVERTIKEGVKVTVPDEVLERLGLKPEDTEEGAVQ